MSFRRRSMLPAGILLASAAVLGSSQAAWAEPSAHEHGADQANNDQGSAQDGEQRVGPLGPNSPGDPTAGVEYFAQHLGTYHFGHPLVGFDVAATSLPGWANYHLQPTGQEVASRVVAPSNAPEVEGDTWVPTAAPQYQDGSEHSTSHKKGQPLNLPVHPTAAPDYLGKWAQGNPKPEEAVPAAQETARRALVPAETSPAVKGDDRVDKRPGPDSPKPVAIAPAEVNDGLQNGWDSGPGAVAGQALSPITGGSSYGASGGQSGHGQHQSSEQGKSQGGKHRSSADDAPAQLGSLLGG